jgi:hypothetical protein
VEDVKQRLLLKGERIHAPNGTATFGLTGDISRQERSTSPGQGSGGAGVDTNEAVVMSSLVCWKPFARIC